MLLLVPVHAAGLTAVNGHEGAWATVIFWVVHLFRLPLFFAMSGFFLALLLGRKGLPETARNRTFRIAVPLLLGLVTLVPLMIFAAQQTDIAISADGVPEGSPFTFEPSFLWFLWYLLVVDAVAITLYLGAPRFLRAAGECFRVLVASPPGGILLLAVLTALALWPSPTWMAGAPAESFVPDLPALAYYALFFALGATLHRDRELIAGAGRNAWRWAACGVVAALPAGLLFSFHNSGHASQPLVHGIAMLVYAIATWSCLMALVGFASRYLTRPRPSLRYLADSSYWIYLSHLPAMVVAVAVVGTTSFGAGPQFLLITAASLAFSLVTYPLFVRYTVVGLMLNGPRTRSRPRRLIGSKPAVQGTASP